jgi:hypothetical protein
MKRFKLSTKLFAASVALGIIIIVSGVVFNMIYTKNHRPTKQQMQQGNTIKSVWNIPLPASRDMEQNDIDSED